MAMATNTEDVDEIKSEFSGAKSIFDKLKSGVMSDKPDFKVISMGMSDDYALAIEEGKHYGQNWKFHIWGTPILTYLCSIVLSINIIGQLMENLLQWNKLLPFW